MRRNRVDKAKSGWNDFEVFIVSCLLVDLFLLCYDNPWGFSLIRQIVKECCKIVIDVSVII